MKLNIYQFSRFSHSVIFWLCDPMDCSMPGFPVHHQLPEFTQIHVHRVGDGIQPSYPLSSPFPPDFNFSQHQGFSSESVLCIRWPKYWSFTFSIICWSTWIRNKRLDSYSRLIFASVSQIIMPYFPFKRKWWLKILWLDTISINIAKVIP